MTQINAGVRAADLYAVSRKSFPTGLPLTPSRTTSVAGAGRIMLTGRNRRIMLPKFLGSKEPADRGIAGPIAVALAVKLAALAVLYFAFFVPPAALGPDRAATAILGLPR